MSFRNERFNEGTLSLDKLAGEIDLGKSRAVSDGGRGTEMIRGALDLKEIQAGEKRMADERQKRVQDRLDKIRETILKADLKELKHGAKKLKKQKEDLLRLFDVMRKTGADREKTIQRLAMILNLRKPSAKRFYDRGVTLLKMLITLEK